MAFGVAQMHLGLAQVAVVQGVQQGTAVFAQMFPVIGDVTEQVLAAEGPHDHFGQVTGNTLRTFVPIGDAALGVNEVHPIIEIVD